jgi:hypothetical protein
MCTNKTFMRGSAVSVNGVSTFKRDTVPTFSDAKRQVGIGGDGSVWRGVRESTRAGVMRRRAAVNGVENERRNTKWQKPCPR